MSKFIDKILSQINEDINNGDITALEELIFVMTSLKGGQEALNNYLSEVEQWVNLKIG